MGSWQEIFLLAVSVFFLAAGAATLNNVQDLRLDRQMKRTCTRPLAMGLVSRTSVLIQAVTLILTGIFCLILSQSILVVAVAASAVILYNGVYTPLKTKTDLALLPGAVCGAMPPYIGWLGAGGALVSFEVSLIFALFFCWQIPHYWLVTLWHKKDYLASRQPSLVQSLREKKLRQLLIVWLAALCLVMHLFALVLARPSLVLIGLISINSFALLLVFLFRLLSLEKGYRSLFLSLNLALFFHMSIVCLARLLA